MEFFDVDAGFGVALIPPMKYAATSDELLLDGAGSREILYGTDLPGLDPHYVIGCVLFARITDEDRHNILHRNAERLLAPFGVEPGGKSPAPIAYLRLRVVGIVKKDYDLLQ